MTTRYFKKELVKRLLLYSWYGKCGLNKILITGSRRWFLFFSLCLDKLPNSANSNWMCFSAVIAPPAAVWMFGSRATRLPATQKPSDVSWPMPCGTRPPPHPPTQEATVNANMNRTNFFLFWKIVKGICSIVAVISIQTIQTSDWL